MKDSPEPGHIPLQATNESGQRPLLAPDEPPAYDIVRGRSDPPVLVVCDHASRRIPRSLRDLGMDQKGLSTHLACDIGAGELTRRVTAELETNAVLAGYSRLVVDCNRHLEDPTAFLTRGDGHIIPGNEGLADEEKTRRADTLYWPYHRAIEQELRRLTVGDRVPALVSIHSFTPVLDGRGRHWDVGILWDTDPRLPRPILDGLRRIPGLVIGDNEPYSGRAPTDFTVDYHAERAGLPHAAFEIRQDHLTTEEGLALWTDRLVRILGPLLNNPNLYRRLPVVPEHDVPGRRGDNPVPG
ncbi:MAG: N-formylglutamate amidohydrolase [Gammaproteobacteria bacterium]